MLCVLFSADHLLVNFFFLLFLNDQQPPIDYSPSLQRQPVYFQRAGDVQLREGKSFSPFGFAHVYMFTCSVMSNSL